MHKKIRYQWQVTGEAVQKFVWYLLVQLSEKSGMTGSANKNYSMKKSKVLIIN